MNPKNEDESKRYQEPAGQRCTAPHPIVPFLFFVGTLLAALAILWLVISILS